MKCLLQLFRRRSLRYLVLVFLFSVFCWTLLTPLNPYGNFVRRAFFDQILDDNFEVEEELDQSDRFLTPEPGQIPVQKEVLAGCVYPYLDPFDQTLYKYMKYPNPVRCRQLQPEFVILDRNRTLHLNLKKNPKAVCKIRTIGGCLEPTRHKIIYGEWRLLNGTQTKVEEDIFEVQCHQGGPNSTMVYQNGFLQVGRREMGRFASAAETRFSTDLIMFESVSWNMLQRLLPASLQYMREMGFFFFEKHGKPGDNTLPNIVPILTGLRFSNVRKYGQMSDYPQDRILEAEKDFPFLWKDFAARNCATFMNHDPHKLWLGIMYYPRNRLRGFYKPPTDFYFRPGHVYHRTQRIPDGGRHCRGSIPYHILSLGLTEQFIQQYKHKCHFSFSDGLNDYTHDSPMHGELVDHDFKQFLMRLNQDELTLNRTVLVVYGDHGQRVNRIKYTYVGQIEERTGFLGIRVPPWFHQKYPKQMQNLMENQQRLTSHFDAYQTIKAILNDDVAGRKASESHGHGQSLFQSVPKERTCREAEIPPAFCVCLEEAGVLNHRDKHLMEPYRYTLLKWFWKNGYEEVKSLQLTKAVRYSTSQLIKNNARSTNEYFVHRTRWKLGDIEFVQLTGKLVGPKKTQWFKAQVQHTRPTGESPLQAENFRLNRPPLLSDKTVPDTLL